MCALPQLLYSIRIGRHVVKQIEHNLLLPWFAGLKLDDGAWHATTFTKSRQRLPDGGIAGALLAGIVRFAEQRDLLSREHLTPDGTLLEAWASHKSFQPNDGLSDTSVGDARNPDVELRERERANETHASTTDPDARLARKSNDTAAGLAYQASVMMDNRHGLVVSGMVGTADGRAEVEQRPVLLSGRPPRMPTQRRHTVGADQGYDTRDFAEGARAFHCTHHIARKAKYSAVDGRPTRHAPMP